MNRCGKIAVKISVWFGVPCGLLWVACGFWWAVAYTVGIVLHEFSHIYTAKILGVETGRVCLNIYGCKGEISGHYTVVEELLIALSGPVFSMVVGLFCGLLSQVFYRLYYPLMNFALCNFVLGAFNMFPVLPFDGGRVLKCLLCCFLKRGQSVRLCVIVSVWAGIGALTAFCYYAFYGRYKLFLLIMGVFIIVGALEEKRSLARCSLDTLTSNRGLKRIKRVRRYAISCEDDLRTAISYFRDDCFNIIDVVTKDGTIEKTMTETELLNEVLK